MLTDPNPDDPLVPEIAHVYKTDRPKPRVAGGGGEAVRARDGAEDTDWSLRHGEEGVLRADGTDTGAARLVW